MFQKAGVAFWNANARAFNRGVGGVGALTALGASVAFAAEAEGAPAGTGGAADDLSSLEELEASAPPVQKLAKRGRILKPLPNPGKYEEHQKECKEVLNLDLFPGARFEVNYAPVQRPDKQMVFGFATNMDSTGQIPGGKTIDLQTQLFVEKALLIAKIDQDYQMLGRLHYNPSQNVGLRALFQSGNEFAAMGEADFKDKFSSVHYKFTHSPHGASHVCSYFQSLTQNFSAGGELAYQGGQGAAVTMAAKHSTSFDKGQQASTWTANLNSSGAFVGSYAQKLNPQVSMAAEFSASADGGRSRRGGGGEGGDSKVTVGALYKYQTFRFQTSLSSAGGMNMALEQTMGPAMALSVCCEMDHWSGGSQWGIGMRIG